MNISERSPLGAGIVFLAILGCSCQSGVRIGVGKLPPARVSPITAPVIEPVNKPASPAQVGWLTAPPSTGGVNGCLGASSDSTSSVDCSSAPPADAIAEMRNMQPAAGAVPSVVARTRLTDGGGAILIVYRDKAARLCGWVDVEVSSGGGGGSPAGFACLPGTSTHPIELSQGGSSDQIHTVWVLAGTVTSQADRIDLAYFDGYRVTLPLNGPLVLEDSSRRVFLLDEHGHADLRRITIRRGGTLLSEQSLPAVPLG